MILHESGGDATPVGLAALLLVHASSTLLMTGLVWFVAVVHYPLMAHVGRDGFSGYQRRHMSRTTWVVAPLMLVEAGSAVALLGIGLTDETAPMSSVWTAIGAVGLAVVWLLTFAVLVPLHARLTTAFDELTHRRLVFWNWWRTAGWSLRSVAAVVLLAEALA